MLTERVAALKVQADQRRAGQLRECGVALRAMKERGESVRDIARMAGISEKTARELIRSSTTGEAGAAAGGRGEDAQPAANGHHSGAVGGAKAGDPLAFAEPLAPAQAWS